MQAAHDASFFLRHLHSCINCLWDAETKGSCQCSSLEPENELKLKLHCVHLYSIKTVGWSTEKSPKLKSCNAINTQSIVSAHKWCGGGCLWWPTMNLKPQGRITLLLLGMGDLTGFQDFRTSSASWNLIWPQQIPVSSMTTVGSCFSLWSLLEVGNGHVKSCPWSSKTCFKQTVN